MPTEIIKTIRASGGDYTTLSAWEAALPASLVAVDEQHTAVCYNDWPSGLNSAVDISGTTTDATRFIKVTVAEGHRHNGTPQTGFFLKGDKGSNGTYINVGSLYTQLEWLDIENTRSGSAANTALNCIWSNIYLTVSNCIGKANGAPVFGAMSSSDTSATKPIYKNCLAWGGSIGFTGTYDSGRTRYIAYNCVAANCTTGFSSGAVRQAELVNCAAYNCTTDFSGTYNAASYNNASEDATAPGTGSLTGISSADFINAAGGDFHLASGSTLIGAGTNLYASFTTDIDGDTWPASGAWDIGFDHYVAAGGGAQTISLSQATETSAAQGITATLGALSVSVGHASETSAAQAITVSASFLASIGVATESNSAQSITAITPGGASIDAAYESDTAHTISPSLGALILALTPATESNTAQAITPSNGFSIALGTAYEVSSVQAITPVPGGLIVTLNAASESDSAQAITVYIPGQEPEQIQKRGGSSQVRKQRKIIVERVDELIEELEDEIQQVPKEKSKLRKAKKLKPAVVEETQENANEWVEYFQAIADAIKDQQKANLLNKQIQEYQDSLNKALEAKEMRELMDQELIQIKRNEEMAFLLMAAL